MIKNEEYRKFVGKYSEELVLEIEGEIKKKGKAKEAKRRVYVDEERYSELNSGGQRGKAYCYLEDFTKELVFDFLEMNSEMDSLGFPEIKVIGFQEYPL